MIWIIFAALFAGFLLGVFFMALLSMARENRKEGTLREGSSLRSILSETRDAPSPRDARNKNSA